MGGRPHDLPMAATIWALLMLVWLGGLLFGLWWIWPLLERMTLTADFVAAIAWLVMGSLAWIAAFNLGRQRYWPR